MRRVLVRLLTLLIFASGTVWPALAYCDDVEPPDRSITHTQDAGTPADSDTGQVCDHCCHMSFHLLGYIISNKSGAIPPAILTAVPLHMEYPAGFPSLPYHPPTA